MPLVHTTLSALFTDIADAIRAKTLSNAKIIADNIPAEISAIPISFVPHVVVGGVNNTAPNKNKIQFRLTNWAADNEFCIAISGQDVSTLKLTAPIWSNNDVIGPGMNQGGWHTTIFKDGSPTDGWTITARLAADGSFNGNEHRWVVVTSYVNGAARSFCYSSTTPIFDVTGGLNTIELTANGLIINGTTFNASQATSLYINNTWSALDISGYKLSDWITYITQFIDPLNIGYAYVGVAPATNQTSLCLKEVRFSDNII